MGEMSAIQLQRISYRNLASPAAWHLSQRCPWPPSPSWIPQLREGFRHLIPTWGVAESCCWSSFESASRECFAQRTCYQGGLPPQKAETEGQRMGPHYRKSRESQWSVSGCLRTIACLRERLEYEVMTPHGCKAVREETYSLSLPPTSEGFWCLPK